ncbi:hypothetical protein [Sorangium sp. So ce233]|uniref:hypothetical protein n=1 Tax=Sorangium sp. So ce233 TaxID=3133290 RepID=UPI003F62AAC6
MRTAHRFLAPSVSNALAFSGSTVYEVSVTPDALGRIDQRTETILGETHSYDYDYDPAGRLTDVVRDGALVAHYDYDANGNRLARTSPAGTEGGTCDDQDRLLTYGTKTYETSPAGDRTSVTDAVTGGTTAFTYDPGGNLRHVELPDGTDIDYLVDGEGHRIWKRRNGVNVQGFLYRSDLQPAAELDGAGGVVARFIYGRGRNVPDLMVKGGVTYRIVTDHLGSPRLVVDVATGVVAQRMDFDEFGRVLLDTNPGFTPFGFAGGLYDRDTGLVRSACATTIRRPDGGRRRIRSGSAGAIPMCTATTTASISWPSSPGRDVGGACSITRQGWKPGPRGSSAASGRSSGTRTSGRRSRSTRRGF